MRGGENFGVNNVSYGNIIVALNTFKYYIKLKYKDSIDDTKSGIYYFVFDINNNNQLTSSFGLTNALIVNGNINNRGSKTFLDLSMGEDKKFSLSLKGNAYKSTNSDTLNETDGIPSELVIGIKENEIPTFTLNLNSNKELFSGKFTKLGYNKLSIGSLDEDIKSFNEAYDKIEEEPESREVAIQLASKIFRTIFQFSKELATDPDSTNKWYTYLNEFVKKYGDLIEKDPELNTLYQRALGSIQNIKTPKQPVEKPAKPVVKPASAPVVKPSSAPASAPVPQALTSKELLNSNYYNFNLLAKKFYDSIKGNSENAEYQEFSNKAFSKLKDFLTENKFLNGSKVNDVGKVITILYQYILKQLIKSKGILNDDQLQQILNSLLTLTYNENSYFNGIKTSQLANVWKFNKEFKRQIDNILESIDGKELPTGQAEGENSTAVVAEDEEEDSTGQKLKGGGNNATVIIENNTDNLNVSEFGEPVIYIKLSRNSGLNITGFGKDSNKIPVFGYLTVGKELLLKLLSMQTNNNVSFEAKQSKYESSLNFLSNYAKANPIIVLTVGTYLLNGITKALVDTGITPEWFQVRHVVSYMGSKIFGDWAGTFLDYTLPMPQGYSPKASTKASTNGSMNVPERPTSSTTSSTTNSTYPYGGKKRKSRNLKKYIKSKTKTKKGKKYNKTRKNY